MAMWSSYTAQRPTFCESIPYIAVCLSRTVSGVGGARAGLYPVYSPGRYSVIVSGLHLVVTVYNRHIGKPACFLPGTLILP